MRLKGYKPAWIMANVYGCDGCGGMTPADDPQVSWTNVLRSKRSDIAYIKDRADDRYGKNARPVIIVKRGHGDERHALYDVPVLVDGHHRVTYAFDTGARYVNTVVLDDRADARTTDGHDLVFHSHGCAGGCDECGGHDASTLARIASRRPILPAWKAA